MAVKKARAVVGHLPKKSSRVCSLFLRRGGTITCIVTSTQRYSADLEQGGLEIPCVLIFKATTEDINKLKILLNLRK